MLRPTERTTPDEWARRNRVYPPTAGIPGPREPSLTPYVIAPSRAVHARTHKRVVFVCGSQMGKSDSVLDVIGARLDQAPLPILYLGPTKQFLEEQWSPRIDDLFKKTESLRRKLAPGRQRMTRRLIAGVHFRMAHGGSSTSLKSDPFGLGISDEVDELLANVKGAGDPIRLVDRRGDTYSDFVHYATSTPSEGPSDVEIDPESGLEFWSEIDPSEISSTVWRLWQGGTRYHWAWPCPLCDEYFIPRFKHLKWSKPVDERGKEMKSDAQLAARTAHIECPNCGGEIIDSCKEDMLARGCYVAPGQSVRKDGTVVGDPPDSWTLSYWVSGLASPFQTWGQRAAEYVEAVRSGDPAEIQAVVNGGFGELYAPGSGDVPEWRELEKLKDVASPYVLGDVPRGVRFLTMAVDVQKNRLVYGIRGWGVRSSSWLIQIGELWGDTVQEEVWEDLEDVLLDQYAGHRIKLALIDSGFRPGNPKAVPENRVYSFCQRHANLCRPTKGRASLVGKPLLPSKIEARVSWRGKLEMVGIELFHLDTDFFKKWVHERIRWPIDEAGAWLLPDDTPDYYLQQVVSEARIKKPGGKSAWVMRTRENHFFDVEAMNAAAGWFLGAHRIVESRAREASAPGDPVAVVAPKKNRMAEFAAALNR